MQIESVISKQTFVVRPLSCNLHVSWRQRWKLLCILLFLSLRWYLTLRLLSMAVGLFLLTWNQYQATLDNRVCIWDSVPSPQMVFSSTVKERRATFYGWKLCREGYSKWNLFSDAWSEQRTRTVSSVIHFYSLLVSVGDAGLRTASLRCFMKNTLHIHRNNALKKL